MSVKESVISNRLGRYFNSRNGLPMFVSAKNQRVLQSVVHWFGKLGFWVIDDENELHNKSIWKLNPAGYAFVIERDEDWTKEVLLSLAICQGDIIIGCTQDESELNIDALSIKVFISNESPEQLSGRFGFGLDAVLTFAEASVQYDLASSDED